MAAVWSGATGSRIKAWTGEIQDGLFGHWVLPIPDLDGDGSADVIISAPNAATDGTGTGVICARSPRSGEEIWQHRGHPHHNLGWDLALTSDQNGDGYRDFFAGSPGKEAGRAYLLSGKDGIRLQTFAPPSDEPSFGWYVAALDDLDADGRDDVVVGAHLTAAKDGSKVGAAYVFSSATAKILRHWMGSEHLSGFGEVVAAVGDLDGDSRDEVVVAAPRTNERSRRHPGEVFVYSSTTGEAIRHFVGRQPGELFGRMVAPARDLNGDGTADLATGAPWHRGAAGSRAGRVEFWSGRNGESLGEIIGDVADAWFGWHIRRAPDPEGLQRPSLLIGSLRYPIDGIAGGGVIDWYVLRPVKERSGATPVATTSGTPAQPPSVPIPAR